jgi:ABC-type proline/glycine betaine transport system ATPase subunit
VDNETTSETLKIKPDAPTVLVVMGMAGSGKTTFVHVNSVINSIEINFLS